MGLAAPGPRTSLPVLAVLAVLALGGCARETPEVREVRKATQEYIRALGRRDMREIAARATCIASTNVMVGGRVLKVEPARTIRMGVLDSLARFSILAQRSADSAWGRADEAHADSLFRRALWVSNRGSVYRNAARAARVSLPGVAIGRNTALETRIVRARIRYSGELVGPKPVDREELIRLLRAPGGKWIIFSKYLESDDPRPEMI